MQTPAQDVVAVARGYSPLQVVFHWIVAALVTYQLLFHQGMKDAWDAVENGERLSSGDGNAASLHFAIGMTIFVLAFARLTLRFTKGAPPIDNPIPIVRVIAVTTHWLLYGFLFFMPITGFSAWFLGIGDAADWHEAGKLILIPLILLHATGALAEQFVFRTGALKRMLVPIHSAPQG